ncbi:hypothetical protein PSACC_01116 [Paramicrosporidium saccamoebae]|uniref:SMP-LTD domain-containing protein n=1 Tax=Paramicrosporidium saccamoebae TaxID=1246581 RepID=A0A2H9TMR9_9FUNG|nr:hypothetical protein PSACC_01116 [Paramicrosporidium saccamoebae]
MSLFLYESEEQLHCAGVAVIEGCKIDLYPHTLLLDEIYKKDFPLRIVSNGEALYANRSTIYLWTASASEKEDWLFALRQAATTASVAITDRAATPYLPQSDPKLTDAIFMERLNRYVRAPTMDKSSQWINAIMGRLFFNMFRSNDLERFFRKKFERKAATMPKPFFLGDLVLKSVLAGQSMPMFSRGQLHSVTNQGELLVSVDVLYPGGFRMQIETEIKWDIPRVKTIIVPIVMSIHVRRLAGRALIRIKPPPSDRLWLGFYAPPQLEVDIEPVVSAKAITWSVIKTAMMKHMQDTMAEFVVLPNMDDFNIPPLIIGDCYGGEKPFELDYIPPSLMSETQKHDLTAQGISTMRSSRGHSPEQLEGIFRERGLLSGSHSLSDLSLDVDLAMDPLTSQSSSRQGLYDEARKSDLLAQEKNADSFTTASPVDNSSSANSSPTRTTKEVISSVRRSVSTFFRTRHVTLFSRDPPDGTLAEHLKTEHVD